MDNLVSVVVPVYNVETVLDRCVQSILAQTYDKLEIILVDDGSRDGSGRLCDQYKTADSRIKVVHQVNQGLGEARNTGIRNATGEYICFVDSDDYIDKNYVYELLTALQTSDSDISVCGYCLVNYLNTKPFNSKEILPFVKESVLFPNQVRDILAKAFVFGDERYQSTVTQTPTKMFRLDYIRNNDLCYHWSWHEDWEQIVRILAKNPQISFVQNALYYYCRDLKRTTLSQGLVPEYYTHQIWNDTFFKENFPEFDYQDVQYYQKLRREFIESRMHILYANLTPEKRQEYLQKLEAEPLYQEVLRVLNGSIAEDNRLARKQGRAARLKRRIQMLAKWLP